MGYNPNEARDSHGRWGSGSGGIHGANLDAGFRAKSKLTPAAGTTAAIIAARGGQRTTASNGNNPVTRPHTDSTAYRGTTFGKRGT